MIEQEIRKACTKCGESKSLSDYYAKRTASDGRMSECRECHRARLRQRYRENPEPMRTYSRAYRALHGEKTRAACRAYHRANRERRLIERQALRFELDTQQVATLRTLDCGICGVEQYGNARRGHHIDHDHSVSGPAGVRGVLCPTCNPMLGFYEKGLRGSYFEGVPMWVAAAKSYLGLYETEVSGGRR